MVETKCHACGNPIFKFPKDAKRVRYHFCSKECRKKRCIPVTCTECKKDFFSDARGYKTAKFCSTKCRDKRNRRKWTTNKGKQATIKCRQCGNHFSVRYSFKDKQEYCSLKCFHATGSLVSLGEDNHNWKEKLNLQCANCGEWFETFPSRKGRRKYCSTECRASGNFARLANGKRTDIEKKMAKALTRANIEYTEQVVMFEKFMVDFKIEEHPIIVQCDGLYWHDRPHVIHRDRGQDNYLSKAGYIVLRFSDKQINSNINMCISKIKQVIKTRQIPLVHY